MKLGSNYLIHNWTSQVNYLGSLALDTNGKYFPLSSYPLLSSLLFDLGYCSLLFHFVKSLQNKIGSL